MSDLVGVDPYWRSIQVVFAALVVPCPVRNIFHKFNGYPNEQGAHFLVTVVT